MRASAARAATAAQRPPDHTHAAHYTRHTRRVYAARRPSGRWQQGAPRQRARRGKGRGSELTAARESPTPSRHHLLLSTHLCGVGPPTARAPPTLAHPPSPTHPPPLPLASPHSLASPSSPLYPPPKYIAALYWAIMTITSIGYGDIRAPDLNTWEQVAAPPLPLAPSGLSPSLIPLYTRSNPSHPPTLTPSTTLSPSTHPTLHPLPQTWCLILMLLGGMIWGSVIATFCGVVANLDPAGTEFRTTMDNLNRFMALQGLPQDMKQSLREYFHQTKHLQLARANKVLIENMSPMLQGQVVWKVNEKWLRHVWFLAQAEDSFMVQLSLHLTAAVFAPAELCPSGYMYIIHRGIALYGGKVLTSGKVWGEDMILSSIHLRSKYAARCMTYVEVYMIGRDDLIDLATKHPATLKLIRRSAFRLGFRREMIRRAQVSIKSKEEAAGIKSKESAADKMLVSVSSRKVDDEQAKEEAQKRAEMDAAMVTGADGDAPAAGPAALPPLASPIKGAGGGGDSGEVISAVQQLLAVHGQQQQQAAAALETRLKKQNDDLLEKVAALSQKLDAMAPPS